MRQREAAVGAASEIPGAPSFFQPEAATIIHNQSFFPRCGWPGVGEEIAEGLNEGGGEVSCDHQFLRKTISKETGAFSFCAVLHSTCAPVLLSNF